jgi:molybdopterin/thiamine biosynthesis adenylyltransferase
MTEGNLNPEERDRYAWQLDVTGFGIEGQQRLKGARVLISRIGGVGGNVAYQLAAAGVGTLVLAHAGNVQAADLNRQLLMSHAGIGQPRIEQARQRLQELNPAVQIVAVGENVSEENASRLVAQADLVVSCAPLFTERLALNRAAMTQGKPLIDCAMFEMEAQLLVVHPGRGPCLECLYPEPPPAWQRRFPVFGAVAGVVGCLGAVEAIKLLGGLSTPEGGSMLLMDLRTLSFRKVNLRQRSDCPACGQANKG